ncbi:MAG: hypothetical protein AABO41_23195 [Acidobacteriota bacterium]
MKVTTLEGVIENGQVRLTSDVRLPEKTKVYVVIPDLEAANVANVRSPRLAHTEQIGDFEKEVVPEMDDACI